MIQALCYLERHLLLQLSLCVQTETRSIHFNYRQSTWLNYQCNPLWGRFGLATLQVQRQNCLGRLRWFFSAGHGRSADEIRSLCNDGHLDRALAALSRMDQKGIVPSLDQYRCLLKACVTRSSLSKAKCVHAHLAQHGLDSSRFLGEYLVSTLVNCGGLEDALQVFSRLPNQTVFSWTAVISGFTRSGQGHEALRMYDCLRLKGLEPNKYTFVSLARACASLADLEKGKRIHADALEFGCGNDRFVGTCLVDMYAKCGSIVSAQTVFDGLSDRDVVLWNVMLAAYAKQGQAGKTLQLYERMWTEKGNPDPGTFVSALQACGTLGEEEAAVSVDGQCAKLRSLVVGKAIHADARSKGCDSDVFVGSTLVSMYGKCGSVVDAHATFDTLPQQDVVAWTALIVAYTQQGLVEEALHLYKQMQEQGVSPDVRTFVSILQGCGMLAEREEEELLDGRCVKVQSLMKGKAIHGDAHRHGYDVDIFVGNTLVSMYGKCGSIADAHNVFDGLSKRDTVSWNAMLAAHAQHGQPVEAVQLYQQMRREGVSPNDRTFVSVLQACGLLAEKEDDGVVDGQFLKVEALGIGKATHGEIMRNGYASDVYVGSTLISMYGKCGSIVDAQNVFNGLPEQNVVSWNTMLSTYALQGLSGKALQTYKEMTEGPISPNEVTLICILQACSNAGGLDVCRHVHHMYVSTRNDLSLLLANTFIHAYGRCASMPDAQNVFDALSEPNVVSWNALIAGYARQGYLAVSLQCYQQMLVAGVKPSGVTFLSLFYACSHAGLVDKGVELFESMSREHGITPEIEHYVSMIDLLGRAGYFIIIEKLLLTMPVQPNLSMWLCLLHACRQHGKVELGEHAFNCAVCIQPRHAAAYVLMSNIYAHAGLWDYSMDVSALEQRGGVWKKPGQSWIEHEQEVHCFMVGDCKHLQLEQLHNLLEEVNVDLPGGRAVNEPSLVLPGPYCFAGDSRGSRRVVPVVDFLSM